MNRIEKKLKEKRKILSVYFTAGFPRLDDTLKIISKLEKCDVDLIEVGTVSYTHLTLPTKA